MGDDDDSSSSSSSSDSLKNAVIRPVIPDGGYGWVVTFASFMCHFIADGIAYSFGIVYPDLLIEFRESKSKTAWIGSLFIGIPLLAAPLAGFFVNKYGCRPAAMIGAIITAIGLLIGSFARSIETLCICYGVIAGIGLAFVYVPATVIPSFWFEKKRALATGIAVSGSGLGTFALAPLLEYLLEEYGWRGSFLIMAGMSLNMLFFGALYRPVEELVKSPRKRFKNKEENPLTRLSESSSEPSEVMEVLSLVAMTRSDSNIDRMDLASTRSPTVYIDRETYLRSATSIPLNQLLRGRHSLLPLSRRDISSVLALAERRRLATSCPELSTEVVEDERSIANRKSWIKRILRGGKNLVQEMCNPMLFKMPVYSIFFLSSFLFSATYDLTFVYLPDHATSQHIDNPSFLISIIGIVSTIGQVLFGFLGDRKCLDPTFLYGSSIALCGVLVTCIPVMTSYASLATFSALFGLLISASFSLETVVIIKILSLDELTTAYSMLMCGQGVASLIGPPIGGKLP